MGVYKKAAVIALIAIFVYLKFGRHEPLKYDVHGHVEPGYEKLKDVYKQNFLDGLETEGSAFAVCHNGKMVVDLWGGYADSDSDRPWKQDTMSTAYSTTKAICALCLAMIVDRGLLSYDDLVTKHWPEFGKNGKEKITVKMLASHEAGLVALDERITFDTLKDWKRMSAMLENQKPNWEIGTGAGYHTLTYGNLIDQLIRRVDPKQRSLGTFFREEVAEPYGIEFYIGLPPELEHRVARLKKMSSLDLFRSLLDVRFDTLPFVYKVMTQPADSIFGRASHNPNWLEGSRGENVFNNPDFHQLELGAANGIGTARALAKLFCVVDSGKIINKTTVDLLLKPVWINTPDITLGMNFTSWGWGFMHSENPTGKYQLGHPGYGGQYAKYDPHNKLSYAYLRNYLVFNIGDLRCKSFKKLEHTLYEVLKK